MSIHREDILEQWVHIYSRWLEQDNESVRLNLCPFYNFMIPYLEEDENGLIVGFDIPELLK